MVPRIWLSVLLCVTTGLIQGSQPEPSGAFGTVRVTVQPLDAGTPLAAYQVEIVDETKRARLVGIEGGSAPFDEPPHYDPAALQPADSDRGNGDRGNAERVIIAAYSLDGPHPAGSVVVATLHYWVEAPGAAAFIPRDLILVDPAGQRFPGHVQLDLEGFSR